VERTDIYIYIYKCDTIWEFIIDAGCLKLALRRVLGLKVEAVTAGEGKYIMKSLIISTIL
jgi:hypothetical protein